MFYGSVQHRYLYGVLKALNPKRDIDISFGSHGLMPTKGNELVIDTINTCQHQYKILGKEISHISASSCVPVDPNSKDPPQDEIDTKAKELYMAWDKARQIPQKYKDAISRGKEYAIGDNDRRLTKRDYRAAVKNSKYRLKALRFEQLTPNDRENLKDLDFDQLTLHDRSQTEKGSSILQEESDGYFGLQSDDQASSVDIAALLRTSTMNKQTTGMKGRSGSLHLDGVPIDQLASIIACIEIRKKHKLLPENAELKFIFYERGSKRIAVMTEDYCKLVHVTKSRGIGYIFTANLNRINSESIAVQMLLEVERIISKFQVIPTRESGKKRLSVIAKEDERVDKYQGFTRVCKTKVNGIEQSFEEVKSNSILDKAVKDICGRRMMKQFLEDVAVVHENTSYSSFPIPYSNIDPQCMELIATLNEQAEKTLNSVGIFLEVKATPKTLEELRASRATANTNKSLPEGWTSHIDVNSGKIYYYNKEQKKSTWSRPKKENNSKDMKARASRKKAAAKKPKETYAEKLQRILEKVSFPFQVQMPAEVVEGQQVQVPHPMTTGYRV